MAEALPTLIANKYEVIRVLGRGGMGTVYEARHNLTKKRFAVKVTHSWVVERHSTVGPRFLREAQIGSSIEHPAIVPVIDGGQQDDGSFYLVFELLEGADLSKAAKTMKPDELARVGIDVLEGLAAAHAKNVIHRDVKPGNVFLATAADGTRHVKLLDFGIAKQLDETIRPITRTGDIVGTIEFMSPEQAASEPVDARSDVYGVGALLYVSITNTILFPGAAPVDRLKKLLSQPAPPIRSVRPDVSLALAAVIDRALAKDRADRFQTALEMKEALEAAALDVLAEQTLVVRERSVAPSPSAVEAPPTDTWIPDTKETPKRGWWRIAFAAVALAVVGAGVTYAMRTSPRTAPSRVVAPESIERAEVVPPPPLEITAPVEATPVEPVPAVTPPPADPPPAESTSPKPRRAVRRKRPRPVAPVPSPAPEPELEPEPAPAAKPKPVIEEPYYSDY